MTPTISSNPLIIPGVPVAEHRHSRVLQKPLAVMLHYDDSSRDDWALEWFEDPRCTNGYTWLVLRDGRLIELANAHSRTPHAGPCRTPFANSTYYGIAAATDGVTPATTAQLDVIVIACRAVFAYHGWKREDAASRIVGHDEEAVWTKTYTSDESLWGKVGRKVDPTGQRHDRRPIIDVADIRRRVAQL
jgi:N-acetyl-anhydromuramyl-L-alanine amidase AmpD